jgi:hypothetical protein
VRAARRKSQPPGNQIPTNCPHERAKYHSCVDHVGSNNPGSNGLGYVEPKEQKGDEIEERRPRHGILRPQHTGGDNGCYRIGGVMQSVQKIKR